MQQPYKLSLSLPDCSKPSCLTNKLYACIESWLVANFFGPIPDTIGSLSQLLFLGLNNNSFTGNIPPSIGNLTKLSWLDLSDNKLQGPIPISSATTLGLDRLKNAKHFHLANKQLSGDI